MCGIAGYWNFLADETAEVMRERVERMTNALRPRGPDSGGILLDPPAGLALGHRRLAIRDLSPAGHQPMTTGDGRFSIIYNGEIYDTAALRRSLEASGALFQGSSDTEETLLACAHLGLPAALREMTGMFAFALFDHQARRLFLVRDRFGVKPLYWGVFGNLFLFGSELKALTALPGWPQTICPDAVAEFLECGYINAPLSIWRGVHKLRPGRWLEVDRNGGIEEHVFWDALAEARTALTDPLPPDEEEILRELDTTLGKAVRARMVSDVPLGAFLSGGVDSSLVTALMQTCSQQPVRTFSIGFEEQAYNEAPYAKAVAAHLGTIHTEAYLREAEALKLIPGIPEMYDEPFADSSQLPTFLLSRLTREHVVVALSGDGGDEIFSGYGRYTHFIENWRRDFQGKPLRNRLIRFLGGRFSQTFLDGLAGMLPGSVRPVNCGQRIIRKAALLNLAPWRYYRRLYLSFWTNGLPLASPPAMRNEADNLDMRGLDLAGQARLMDIHTYLPGDILVKVDRASMAASLEVRPPLLDHHVFRFAWRMPACMHVRDGMGKYILRRLLYRYVPRHLVDRPKMGFGVPIDLWLRGPLRPWAEALLHPRRMETEGWLDAAAVSRIWQKHLHGEEWQYWLWPVLMFQAWLERASGSPRADARSESLPCRILSH